MIQIKRVYDDPSKDDGYRVLVDRLWPRGIKKEEAHLDQWMKEIAPTVELREWFGHDPSKWDEFQKRYRAEIEKHPDDIAELQKKAKDGNLTLVFAAKDVEHNNAVVLKEVVECG
jgi:uncharacterized protein YeaO (DUF488 family)